MTNKNNNKACSVRNFEVGTGVEAGLGDRVPEKEQVTIVSRSDTVDMKNESNRACSVRDVSVGTWGRGRVT